MSEQDVDLNMSRQELKELEERAEFLRTRAVGVRSGQIFDPGLGDTASLEDVEAQIRKLRAHIEECVGSASKR